MAAKRGALGSGHQAIEFGRIGEGKRSVACEESNIQPGAFRRASTAPYIGTRATCWQGDDETPSPDVFYLTVVRASQVHPDAAWIDDPTDLWTKIRGDLQNDAYAVLIDDFDPHPTTPTVNCGVIVPRP